MDNETTINLIKQAQNGDENAKEQLVRMNMGLVWGIVMRFLNRGYETDDLVQIGSMGLVKAINKFSTEFNTKFSTYAVHMILGEIRRFIRDDNPVKVSRSLKETAAKVTKLRDEIIKSTGKEPAIGEIAEAVGITAEEVAACLEIPQTPVSLDDVIYQDNGNPIHLADRLTGVENPNIWINKITIKEALDKLDPREKQLITLRFMKDLTQAQAAKVLKISQVQVSRLERKIITKLREQILD